MHLTKTNPDANLYRYYHMDIVKGLFGDWGLVREWGRIGSSGQLRTDWFETEHDAKGARFALHMTKAKRGYD
ncbi:WGR domain-containing protein [Octadecabacter antarcticus]|uniref:WGR domain-containing protein n=1 Tax=Octadecabacter antarcticus TaxID=1217908 RepID=UPI00030A3C47|nr:WGR domain-containing protein [Octadecabacter antarcticus]